MIDYFNIINEQIKNPKLLRIYLIHVTLVTKKALDIANKLNDETIDLEFLEEASMLHDIGIVKIKDTDIYCEGELPYLCHLDEGYKILKYEYNLPKHAEVSLKHSNITKEEIKSGNLPLKYDNYVPDTIEEEIIAYADKFYTKLPHVLWKERTLERVKSNQLKYGNSSFKYLEYLINKFE